MTNGSDRKLSSAADWLPLALAVLGVAGLLYVRGITPTLDFANVAPHPTINQLLAYQAITLAMTLVFLAVTYLVEREAFVRFTGRGTINAPAGPVPWLGINKTTRWDEVGRNFAVIITAVTAVFVYLNVVRGQPLGPAVRWLPWVLILSVSNSFVEEYLTRFLVVVGLTGRVPDRWIRWSSALLFGIPHFFGVPGGVVGSILAGFLGWLLAKSVLETEGMFWAWFLHFLQDVVIFLGLLAAIS